MWPKADGDLGPGDRQRGEGLYMTDRSLAFLLPPMQHQQFRLSAQTFQNHRQAAKAYQRVLLLSLQFLSHQLQQTASYQNKLLDHLLFLQLLVLIMYRQLPLFLRQFKTQRVEQIKSDQAQFSLLQFLSQLLPLIQHQQDRCGSRSRTHKTQTGSLLELHNPLVGQA